MTGRLPLDGIRIIDLTWAGAGPFGMLLLGYLGAEIIKVESRQRMDVSRGGFIKRADRLVSPNYADLNLNKRSFTLDLSKSTGVGLLREIAAVSDVIASSYRPGVMERLGLDYDSLRCSRPDIIMAAVSSSGQTGPEAQFAGFASIFSVLGGIGYLTGYPDAGPAALSDSTDLRVGNALAFGVLAALWRRRETGQGGVVDLAARETVATYMGEQLMDYQMNGRLGERFGNRHPKIAPHGVYRCSGDDRWISIAVASDNEFGGLCGAIGQPDLAADTRFAANEARLEHREALDVIIAAWTAERSAGEAMRALQAAGVAAFPSYNAVGLSDDEHLSARGAFLPIDQPGLGMLPVLRPAWRSVGAPEVPHRPAPLLAEDNGWVLGDVLGLSPDRVRALEEEGALS